MRRLIFAFVLLLSACTDTPTPPTPPAPTGKAPVINTQPADTTVDAGKYIYLYAKVDDVKDVTAEWTKNGAKIPSDSQVTSDGTTNWSVWIPSAVLADAGKYQVTFSNPYGKTVSNAANVLVNAVTPVPDPIPDPTPVTGVWLGGCASCDNDEVGITSLERLVGRNVDYALAWGWFPTLNDFTYSVTWIKENHGGHKLIWSMPMIMSGSKLADCINGKFDSGYKEWARVAGGVDPEAIIRTGHEMQGNWYDWGFGVGGTPAEYAQCFQHIVKAMREVSPKLKFDWNPGLGSWAGNDAVPAYPGDEYVDIISLDTYEDTQWDKGTPDQRWDHFLNADGRGLTFWNDFATKHGKPLAFDEWASNYNDGEYVTRMANWMKGKNIHHQMYWNSNAAFSGLLSDHPVNAAAFKKAFGASGLRASVMKSTKGKTKKVPATKTPKKHTEHKH